MKRGLIASYVAGICDVNIGASYASILRLFAPEFISALILFSMINLLDARFIATLNSTSTYATLGFSNTFLHFLVKIAEGTSLIITITAGQYNGLGEFKKAGHMLVDAFWLIVIMAAIVSSILFFGAPWIYAYLNVPERMVVLGVPFLRLRAISIFFTFLYFAFTAFLRGIKNTQTPMYIFSLGAIVFVFFDYVLIFGKFGFPEMRLQGSALAGVIQYGFMFFVLMIIVLYDKTYRKYSISLVSSIADWATIKRLANLSWPLMIDKATMAGAYVWLAKMIAPMGTNAIASYSVIKDIERVGFLPAIAFAQIITLLASNDFGRGDTDSVKSNIKKIVFLASLMVFGLLFILSFNPSFFICIFDLNGSFTGFASKALPIISLLVFFDVLQLILAGAMRGVGNVKYVMWVRFFVCFGIFGPLSYIVSCIPMKNILFKFIIIYGMFYVSSALMSVLYIRKFRRDY
ncbi:hypothetical protein A3F06_03180 [candidate division TM6 bacterium RIFCSPHIGHO2_12_FULL_36_22]|nr:MAG: hypothetical protein A3F06_03180 [candidate division TM6 bacterium RIFCSPHIGHO2_12_FULL_36_22]